MILNANNVQGRKSMQGMQNGARGCTQEDRNITGLLFNTLIPCPLGRLTFPLNGDIHPDEWTLRYAMLKQSFLFFPTAKVNTDEVISINLLVHFE